MSRGRGLNHAYVALVQSDLDCLPDQATPPQTAREVLDQILATTHAELTATETWATFHPDTPATPATRAAPRQRLTDLTAAAPRRFPGPAHDYARPDPAGHAPTIDR